MDGATLAAREPELLFYSVEVSALALDAAVVDASVVSATAAAGELFLVVKHATSDRSYQLPLSLGDVSTSLGFKSASHGEGPPREDSRTLPPGHPHSTIRRQGVDGVDCAVLPTSLHHVFAIPYEDNSAVRSSAAVFSVSLVRRLPNTRIVLARTADPGDASIAACEHVAWPEPLSLAKSTQEAGNGGLQLQVTLLDGNGLRRAKKSGKGSAPAWGTVALTAIAQGDSRSQSSGAASSQPTETHQWLRCNVSHSVSFHGPPQMRNNGAEQPKLRRAIDDPVFADALRATLEHFVALDVTASTRSHAVGTGVWASFPVFGGDSGTVIDAVAQLGQLSASSAAGPDSTMAAKSIYGGMLKANVKLQRQQQKNQGPRGDGATATLRSQPQLLPVHGTDETHVAFRLATLRRVDRDEWQAARDDALNAASTSGTPVIPFPEAGGSERSVTSRIAGAASFGLTDLSRQVQAQASGASVDVDVPIRPSLRVQFLQLFRERYRWGLEEAAASDASFDADLQSLDLAALGCDLSVRVSFKTADVVKARASMGSMRRPPSRSAADLAIADARCALLVQRAYSTHQHNEARRREEFHSRGGGDGHTIPPALHTLASSAVEAANEVFSSTASVTLDSPEFVDRISTTLDGASLPKLLKAAAKNSDSSGDVSDVAHVHPNVMHFLFTLDSFRRSSSIDASAATEPFMGQWDARETLQPASADAALRPSFDFGLNAQEHVGLWAAADVSVALSNAARGLEALLFVAGVLRQVSDSWLLRMLLCIVWWNACLHPVVGVPSLLLSGCLLAWRTRQQVGGAVAGASSNTTVVAEFRAAARSELAAATDAASIANHLALAKTLRRIAADFSPLLPASKQLGIARLVLAATASVLVASMVPAEVQSGVVVATAGTMLCFVPLPLRVSGAGPQRRSLVPL